MKHTKKLRAVAVTLVVTLLMTVFSVGAFGLQDILGGLAGSSDLSGLGDILGGFNLEDFDINKILGSFSQSDYSGILGSIIASLGDEYAGFTNNEIIVALGKVINDLIANGGDVSKIDFNSSEIIAMIGKYLKQGEKDETETGENESTLLLPESSTAENTKPPESEAESRAPATSAWKPSTNPPAYQGSPSYPVISDPTTAAPATEYYSYVTQESVTQALLTESPSYAVTDKNDNENSEKGVTKQMVIGIIILIISAAAVVVVAVFLKKNRE